MNYRLVLAIPCLLTSLHVSALEDCASVPPQKLARCLVDNLRSQPLDYSLQSVDRKKGYALYHYRMSSQTWDPEPVLEPRHWQHRVEIHVPDDALPGKALLVVNNGVLHHGPEQTPDYSEQQLRDIALGTRTVVVMISDAPNQYVTFSDAEKPLREDEAVAHTWATWLRDPAAAPELPLHLPMAAAASRAMDLLEKEQAPGGRLAKLRIDEFVISGASKRGWSSWLTAMADDRVAAIVPAVIDIADTSDMLNGLRKRYGDNWPAALWPYQAAGVLQQLNSPGFDRLMSLMDPMRYLDEPGERLAIPKYLVSASGDDFFAPDQVTDYVQRMPGQTSMRVLPNSDHGGVRAHVTSTLAPLLGRIQSGRPLPSVQVSRLDQPGRVEVRLSEAPVAVKLWTAINRDDRDFRHACGIRYSSQTLPANQAFSLEGWTAPESGWQARFIEVRFADEFVATSAVDVLPKKFPKHPPKDLGGACRTFPG